MRQKLVCLLYYSYCYLYVCFMGATVYFIHACTIQDSPNALSSREQMIYVWSSVPLYLGIPDRLCICVVPNTTGIFEF